MLQIETLSSGRRRRWVFYRSREGGGGPQWGQQNGLQGGTNVATKKTGKTDGVRKDRTQNVSRKNRLNQENVEKKARLTRQKAAFRQFHLKFI